MSRKGMKITGINLKTCRCGGHPVEAGPSEPGFRILCEECGRTTGALEDIAQAVKAWNRIARRRTFWYCLSCNGRFCDFPYASNEYLDTNLIHRFRVTCKIHCLWLNLKERFHGGKRNGNGGDRRKRP